MNAKTAVKATCTTCGRHSHTVVNQTCQSCRTQCAWHAGCNSPAMPGLLICAFHVMEAGR